MNAAGLRLPEIRDWYARALEPKAFMLLEASAHAQRIFLTDQGNAVMREIVGFLSKP